VTRLVIGGGGVTAVVEPERGGKLISLTDAVGREWLAQPADPRRQPDRGDAVFTSSDPAGWDECAPTIDACRIGDRAVPDHGDLWTAEWTVVASAPEVLELSVIGRSLDYRLTRRITSTRNGLRFDYSAAALGADIPFLWAAHPQFVSPAGTTVVLPASVHTVIDVIDPAGPTLAWSADLAIVESLPTGGCRKLYLEPDHPVDSAILRYPDGAKLTMSWTNCPYLGLWFDNGAYSREPVIAIEPALGFRDSLAWALEQGRAPMLALGTELSWSLEIAISAGT
jgi:hypothetical protein